MTDYGMIVYNNDNLYIQFFDEILNSQNILCEKAEYDTGILVSEDGSTKIEGYKIKVENIRSMYSFSIGQAFLNSLVIIYEDGTVDVLTINNDESQLVIESFEKNYKGIKNAIAAYKKDLLGGHGFDFIYKN